MADDKPIRRLQDDEVQQFFRAIRRRRRALFVRRDMCLFNLILSYGLREAEAAELKLTDIDLRRKTISIKRKKQGQAQAYYLSDENVQLIKDWLKRRKRLIGARENPFLFPSQVSGAKGHISVDQIYFVFRDYAEQARLKGGGGPHRLRHTCASKLAERGFSAFQIQRRLGHKSIQM